MSTARTRRCWSGESSSRSFWKICRHVCLDGALGDAESGRDSLVRQAFGDQSENLRSRSVSPGRGLAVAGAPAAGHDRRVDDRLSLHDAPQGVDDRDDVEDAFLQEVADPPRVLLGSRSA